MKLMFLAALGCGGLSAASLQGNLLYGARQYLELRVKAGTLSKNVAKPILLCNTCMASFWGTIVYWVAGAGFGWITSWFCLILWPFAITGTAFLNLLSWWLYLALKQVATQCPPSQSSGPLSGAN